MSFRTNLKIGDVVWLPAPSTPTYPQQGIVVKVSQNEFPLVYDSFLSIECLLRDDCRLATVDFVFFCRARAIHAAELGRKHTAIKKELAESLCGLLREEGSVNEPSMGQSERMDFFSSATTTLKRNRESLVALRQAREQGLKASSYRVSEERSFYGHVDSRVVAEVFERAEAGEDLREQLEVVYAMWKEMSSFGAMFARATGRRGTSMKTQS